MDEMGRNGGDTKGFWLGSRQEGSEGNYAGTSFLALLKETT